MAISHIRWLRSGAPDTDKVLAYAGRELAGYILKITGARPDVRGARQATSGGGTAWLGICDRLAAPSAGLTPALWDDGYAIWSDGGDLFIAGRNARSVLFGVYAFLERQGVRFVRPGPDGEVIPHADTLSLPAAPVIEEPRYRHRGLCIEGAPSIEHALGTVDWCAKQRMNTVFLQFLSSRYFYNLWYERPYNPRYGRAPLTTEEALALDDRLIAAMKQRGLVFHRVGHGWTSAAFGMPRSGWVKADEAVPPEYVRWLAELNGERKLFEEIPINTELCYSYQPAFDAFVETIVRYCEAHPELDVVHVWLSDARNNKCECADCRKLSISDWYAVIINALSEVLHQRVPAMRFVFLCYIELLWAPEQVTVEDRYGNAIMMFAPINRCYGHTLADPACDDGLSWPRPALNHATFPMYNAFYPKTLGNWQRAFGGDSFDFDYHLMWHQWGQLTDTPVAQVYYEDLKQLKAIGLNGLVSCQSWRAFYPSGLAMYALARSLWSGDVSWEELRRDHFDAAFGEHAGFADGYFERVESYLDTGDEHRRAVPLVDVDEAGLAAVIAYLDVALDEAATRRAGTDGTVRRSLDLLIHHARLLRYLAQANRARQIGDMDEANRSFDAAAEFLRRTEPRTARYLDTQLALRMGVEGQRRRSGRPF